MAKQPAKQSIVKVLADEAEQKELAKQYAVIEQYPSFALLSVSPADAKKLAKSNLVEDITDDYVIRVDGRELTPAAAAPTRRATRSARDAATPLGAPDAGAHHYLVQFIGPIKEEWLADVKKAGGTVREPHDGFVYVVRERESLGEDIGPVLRARRDLLPP